MFFRRFQLVVALGLLTLSTTAHARPNVVLVMTDDQGYGDFGATGNTVIETPSIDAMARRSATMTQFYVSPVCSPTRACLMTGRYNHRTRVIDTWLGRSMMDPAEVTVAEVLQKAGYATGVFGKWHLGDCYPMRPIDQGFERAFVHKGGGLAQPSEPRENGRRYTDAILFDNGKQVQTKGYCTDVYFDAAFDFMADAVAKKRPFFAYVPTNAPHGPYHDVPEKLRKHYMAKRDGLVSLMVNPPKGKRLDSEVDKLARIAAMITNVDENVGRLFKKLDELGATKDTMVIFLVDNGPNSRRYVGPFRGMKSEVLEGGIRTPLWVQWPARLKAGVRSDEPAAHIDLMPTILHACGVAPPQGLKLDGKSLLRALNGERGTLPDRPIVIQSHRGDKPARYHHFMIRHGQWKLVHNSGFGREQLVGAPRLQLYDVVKDPGERQDLAAAKPDVVARLKKEYEAWLDDVSSTRPDNYAPPRIVVGSPHENPSVLTRQDWRGGTWRRDAIGHWLLRVERAGAFDIRLIFDPGQRGETAMVRIGGTQHAVDVPNEADSLVIRGVQLKAGNTELHASLERDGKRRGIYQAVVVRK